MSPKLVQVLFSIVVVGGGLVYLVGATMSEDLEYYKMVDEVVAEPERWVGPRLRMGGHVQEGSIFNRPGTLEYRFTVEENGASMPVHYTGVVPDTFTENVEVVVTGHALEEGHFEADEVFAKCPSKYEGAETTGEYDVFGQPLSRQDEPYGEAGAAGGTGGSY